MVTRGTAANAERMGTRIIHPDEGEVLGPERGVRDRFLVDGASWGGRIAVVEHLLAPRSIAAPLHRHSREDEFSHILEGTVWYVTDGEEHVARAGDLVHKPRGEWHTFWNAADEPARVLELIVPGGLEELFRSLARSADVDLVALAAEYGCEIDEAATVPILERYGLTFG